MNINMPMRLPALAFALSFLAAVELCVAAEHDNSIVSHIPRTQVNSRAIAAIGYSKRLHALEIEFRNGRIYRYLDVPITTYERMLSAPSKARYYDAEIRRHFRSVHVKPPAER
jgi:hypothetical protein